MKPFSTLLAILLFTSFGFSQLEPTGFIPGSAYTPHIYADQIVTLASVSGRLFRSTDNGQNWTQVTDGLGPGVIGSGTIEEADGVLFLSCSEQDKLYRSTDYGASWEPANDGIESQLAVQQMRNITSNEGHIFIGHQYMLKHSTDQGESWEDTELSNSCTALANLDGEIWVGQQVSVKYSEDNGENWSTLISDPHTHPSAEVLCFAQKGERIFAGLSFDELSSLKYTEDHGVSWDTLGGFSQVLDIKVLGESIYLRSPNGIYKSIDDGHNWSQIQEFSQIPLDFDIVGLQCWAGTISGPVRLNLNNSEIFQSDISVGNTHDITSIDQTLFNLSNHLLYRSDNDGESWQNAMQSVPNSGQGLNRIESYGNKLLISSNGQNEFAALSEDAGETFEEVPSTPHGTAAYIMNGDRIYSFSFIDYTFWYSDDLGQNWESATKFPAQIDNSFNTFECLEKVGDVLIAGFTGGVAVSTNNGEHWNFHEHSGSVFKSISGWDDKLIAIVSAELDGDKTIMKSSDNGETWTDASSGFASQNEEITPMQLMMLENRVYCTNGAEPFDEDSGKIFALNANGNWYEVPELGIPPMEVICMTKTSSGIFAGLRHYGVWSTQDVAFGIDDNEVESSRINLYPNPAKEFIQIQTDSKGDYQIWNLQGQLVQFGTVNSSIQTIQTDSLKSGIYIFTLKTDKRIVTERFVVN
ncbi:T9SS type A sorting domain-containing protein [Halocola ammonii]